MPFCWIWSPRADSSWSAYITALPERQPGLPQEMHEGDEPGAGVAGVAAPFHLRGLGWEQRSESVAFLITQETRNVADRRLCISFIDERKTFHRHLAVGAGGLGRRQVGGAKKMVLHFFFLPQGLVFVSV